MTPGSIVRGLAAAAALVAVSCAAPAPAPEAPSPRPARTAAPSASSGAAPAPAGQRQSFAALGAPVPRTEPAPIALVLVYVDLAKSPGSPVLEAAGAALRASDHATAKQKLAAALEKLDPAADFAAWLVAHTLWGRACKETGDLPCAERQYQIVRSAWSDPVAAEQKARGDEPDALVQKQTLGRALTAVGEAHYFFAEKHQKEKVGPIKMPEYKGNGSQKDVALHNVSVMMPWMKSTITALNAAELEYNKILTLAPGPPALWSIQAAAAVARMWDTFVQEIHNAPTPSDFKKRGAEQLLRDWQQVLVVTAYPSQKHARKVYELCRDIAAKAPGYDEIAKECVDWLDKNPAPETPPQPPEWAKAFMSPAALKKLEAEGK